MAIAYKSAGTGAATEASGGDLAPTCPAVVDAGDILIGHVMWESNVTAPSTPSGWTLLNGPADIESGSARHWIFGKVAAGTEDGAAISFGTPAVTTMRTARIYSFSGRVAGTITELVTGFASTSHATDPQMPTVTTIRTGALAVACVGQLDDNAMASATGESGGDWTEAVAEYTQLATTPDSCLNLQTCTPTANPGTVSGGSISTVNDPCGVIGFQIQAEAPQLATPGVLSLTTAKFAPVIKLAVIPGVKALALTTFAPKVNLAVIPGVKALTTTTFAPTITVGANVIVTPPTLALVTATFAPVVKLTIIPGVVALTMTTFAPSVIFGMVITPGVLALTTATFAPVIRLAVIPGVRALTLTTFAPRVNLVVVPPPATLTTTGFAPVLRLSVIPPTKALTLATFAPVVAWGIVPPTLTLTTTRFIPVLKLTVIPGARALLLTTYAPTITTGGGGGGVVVTPPTATLTLAAFAPIVALRITPPPLILATVGFAPHLNLGLVPGTAALVMTGHAPVLAITANVIVIVPTLRLTLTMFAPMAYQRGPVWVSCVGAAATRIACTGRASTRSDLTGAAAARGGLVGSPTTVVPCVGVAAERVVLVGEAL